MIKPKRSIVSVILQLLRQLNNLDRSKTIACSASFCFGLKFKVSLSSTQTNLFKNTLEIHVYSAKSPKITTECTNMRSDRSGRKARISGLAGNEHARNRTLPDLPSVSVCREIHCLTSEFHGKFHAKNRYRMNHKAMRAISAFQSKFTLAMNFS